MAQQAAAEPACDPNAITGPGARPRDEPTGGFAVEGEKRTEKPLRPLREIASDDLDFVTPRAIRESEIEAAQPRDAGLGGERERNDRRHRAAAHRRDVAEIALEHLGAHGR